MKKTKIATLLLIVMFSCSKKQEYIFLCTNDTHSQIEAVEKTAKNYPGLGGYIQRASLIDSIRNAEKTVFIFDAGDFFQGSPYFNLYKGRIEIESYNRMKYDAVTLGNHEFDNGLDTLAARLQEAKFTVVCSNYETKNTQLENLVKPYAIIKRNGIKIGVIGLGVSPESLILKSNFGDLKYLDPIETANHYAKLLKNKYRCDKIIVLSHIGTEYEDQTLPSDTKLAEKSSNIDIIFGGHTHKCISKKILNQNQDTVYLIQAGKTGGYIDYVKITE